MVIGSLLKNSLEATFSSKRDVLSVWKEPFSVFANFWVTTVKPFFEKFRESFENYLNQSLVRRSLLENAFEATLRSETNVVSFWKENFYVFLKIFEWWRWNYFQENWGKAFKTIEIKVWSYEGSWKMVLKLPWAKKEMLWAFEKSIFQVYANFSLMKLKPFFGKDRKSIQCYLNQNLVIGSLLENGFEATLNWKTSFVRVWKEYFSVFC